jgi:aminomethyltransferase
MVDFGGWRMPVRYTTIIEEHRAVRRKAGLFDICHMGRFKVMGPDRVRFLDSVCTRRIDDMERGEARYSHVCNSAGGILDDVICYLFGDFLLVVVNASNRDKILGWFQEHLGNYDAYVADSSEELAMIALQGPRSEGILQRMTGDRLSELQYYRGVKGKIGGVPSIIVRTGYTGEDGFEIIFPVEQSERFWMELLEIGREAGLVPVGLGARDTLRIEAAMPLYGNEISEETNPLEAGLGFAVDLDEPGDFIGKEALLEVRRTGLRRKIAGFHVKGSRVARQGHRIFKDDRPVGEVTSGTYSPMLDRNICMGYIPVGYTRGKAGLEVDIRGRRSRLRRVRRPFCEREEYEGSR